MLVTKQKLFSIRESWAVLQREVRSKNKGHINLSSGNPLNNPFSPSVNAARQSLEHHLVSTYLGPCGIDEIRTSLLTFCETLGLVPSDQRLTKDYLLPGMGSTHLYACVIEILAKKSRADNSGKTPVLLMPVPTYGLFLTQPNVFDFEIETLPLKEENDWQSNPHELEDLIRKINNSSDRFVAAYYRANPSNPMGSIDGSEVTKKISNILEQNNVFFIDDLAYFGLDDQKKDIGILAKYNFDHGVTLFSLSKAFCLPGLRSGFMCGPKWIVSEIAKIVERTIYSFSLPSAAALAAAFAEKNRPSRESYFNINHLEYQKRLQLLKVLVDGMGTTHGVTPARQREIETLVCKVFANRNEANDILKNGIPQIELVNCDMAAGYFAVLGLRELQTLHYGTQRLTDSFQLAAAIVMQQNILTLPMSATLAEGPLGQGIRVSFGLSEERIVRGMRGIYRVLKQLTDEPDHDMQKQLEAQGVLIPAGLGKMWC